MSSQFPILFIFPFILPKTNEKKNPKEKLYIILFFSFFPRKQKYIKFIFSIYLNLKEKIHFLARKTTRNFHYVLIQRTLLNSLILCFGDCLLIIFPHEIIIQVKHWKRITNFKIYFQDVLISRRSLNKISIAFQITIK